jgi:hypothetical protein
MKNSWVVVRKNSGNRKINPDNTSDFAVPNMDDIELF